MLTLRTTGEAGVATQNVQRGGWTAGHSSRRAERRPIRVRQFAPPVSIAWTLWQLQHEAFVASAHHLLRS